MDKEKWVEDDGGAAFPIRGSAWNGMSLLDWFAGQALSGIMADPNVKCSSELNPRSAKDAYDLAAAMIAEKAKRRENA